MPDNSDHVMNLRCITWDEDGKFVGATDKNSQQSVLTRNTAHSCCSKSCTAPRCGMAAGYTIGSLETQLVLLKIYIIQLFQLIRPRGPTYYIQAGIFRKTSYPWEMYVNSKCKENKVGTLLG